MIKIAFSGVFDLKNYGDHLFYILFEKMLENRGIPYEMDLFSPYEMQQEFYENRSVYALKDMERMHIAKEYDMLVVGGGGIINLLYSEQRISGDEFEKYSFSDLWVIPCLIAEKYGVACIWNSPEVPNVFPKEMSRLVRTLAREIDYISVRDEKSREILVECGVAKECISVIPDTALAVNKYFKIEELKEHAADILGFEDKYIVFHSNRWIPKESYGELDKLFSDAVEKGYKVVFLPLAYTHADEEILKEIAAAVKTEVIWIEKKLGVYDMMSILAASVLYVGVSFHGAVTAMQYGKRAIAYDYMHNKKTRTLFEMFGKIQYYVEDYENLYKMYIDIMSEENYSIDNSDNEKRIEGHFDRILGMYGEAGEKKDKSPEEVNACSDFQDNESNFIFNITRGIEDANMAMMKKEKRLRENADEISNLQKELRAYNELSKLYKSQSDDFENELKKTQELLKYYIAKSEEIEKQLAGISESFLERHNRCMELEKTIADMEKTKAWRLRKKIRKMLRKDK